jgi:hypothetical protein
MMAGPGSEMLSRVVLRLCDVVVPRVDAGVILMAWLGRSRRTQRRQSNTTTRQYNSCLERHFKSPLLVEAPQRKMLRCNGRYSSVADGYFVIISR